MGTYPPLFIDDVIRVYSNCAQRKGFTTHKLDYATSSVCDIGARFGHKTTHSILRKSDL